MFAMLLTLGVTSVYANTAEGTVGLPILGTTGAPALAAPSLFSGAISVLYADGTPVVLSTNQVTLNVCNTSCVTVTANAEADSSRNIYVLIHATYVTYRHGYNLHQSLRSSG